MKLSSTSDSELIAALVTKDSAPLDEAVAGAMRRLEGAYSIVALSEGTLIAFRDPFGFRPLALGRLDGEWVVASETCALDLVGAAFEREVAPGELVLVDEDGLRSMQAVEPAEHGALCIFEFFYLARPDTRLEGVEVHGARVRMGERLAAEAPVDADLVLPIPDSGTPAAIGFSRATRHPVQRGPDQEPLRRPHVHPARAGAARAGDKLKYNPLAELAGKRVVAVDDSIVRGNTTRQIVQMLFDAGATEVHVRVSSPPVIGQCFYGIDFADPAELIASDRRVEEIREHIGATSLAYLSLEGLAGVDAPPGVGALPRLPDARLPDRRARRRDEAQVRRPLEVLRTSSG